MQTSGQMPALSDGVGAPKKPTKKKKPIAANAKVILDLLAARVKKGR